MIIGGFRIENSKSAKPPSFVYQFSFYFKNDRSDSGLNFVQKFESQTVAADQHED